MRPDSEAMPVKCSTTSTGNNSSELNSPKKPVAVDRLYWSKQQQADDALHHTHTHTKTKTQQKTRLEDWHTKEEGHANGILVRQEPANHSGVRSIADQQPVVSLRECVRE